MSEPLLGAHRLAGGGTSFLVWAPGAGRVEVVADPAREPLSRIGDGYHGARLGSIPPGTRYRYSQDGGEPLPDPASRLQPEGVYGPSMVVDGSYDWSDAEWRGLELEEYVFYEIHVGTFTPEGTFEAILPRLDDLAELGVTAIELMPVVQFPGERNWGYDGVFPYAVQSSYGGPEGLKRLVDACHARRLAVVLDVVYNHLGPEGNVLARYGPYFTDRYRTPWGDAINFDGPDSDPVRRFFIDNAVRWAEEFHIDALRLDAVHSILDRSAVPFLEELAAAVHEAGDRAGRRVAVIAESDDNDPRLVVPVGEGGLGLDAVWTDDFHHALFAHLTGERQGYYQDFGPLSCLARAFEGGFVYTGQRSAYRGRRHGRPADRVPAAAHVVCAQNHDQIGNRARSDRLAAVVDFESLKLAAAAVVLSPYLPLLFMGDEWGETAPFPYFVDHSDPELLEAVRRGRAAEFTAFDWEGEIADPAAPATFASARPDWGAWERDPRAAKMRDYHRELLSIRRTIPSIADLSKSDLRTSISEDDQLLVVRRNAAERPGSILVLHFGHESRDWAPDQNTAWELRLDSAHERWGGPGSDPSTLAPSSARLLIRPSQ